MSPAADTDTLAVSRGASNASGLRVLILALFFIFGGITSLNNVILPRMKEIFALNFTEAMLVQFSFFIAFAVVSMPGAALVKRLGYIRGAVVGLVMMTMGCLLFIPASASATFGLFLVALFVLASGVVIVQVVSNPLISLLGPPRTAHSRLTFAQGINSLGTILFPRLGTTLILGGLATVVAGQPRGAALHAYRVAATRMVVYTYTSLALALGLVAAIVWRSRSLLQGDRQKSGSILSGFDLFANPRFRFGTACIFLYVGSEVTIGSLIVNYVQRKSVLNISTALAGSYIPYYWGGAMVGRFLGSAALTRFNPGKTLSCAACGAVLLTLLSANSTGAVSAWSLLAIGLMNSIMFPTIFSLTSEGLGPRTADASGVLNTAIFGGAIIPLLTGAIADLGGSLNAALYLPALCYGVIACFGIYARKPVIAPA